MLIKLGNHATAWFAFLDIVQAFLEPQPRHTFNRVWRIQTISADISMTLRTAPYY